jgi:hypothetical protein
MAFDPAAIDRESVMLGLLNAMVALRLASAAVQPRRVVVVDHPIPRRSVPDEDVTDPRMDAPEPPPRRPRLPPPSEDDSIDISEQVRPLRRIH